MPAVKRVPKPFGALMAFGKRWNSAKALAEQKTAPTEDDRVVRETPERDVEDDVEETTAVAMKEMENEDSQIDHNNHNEAAGCNPDEGDGEVDNDDNHDDDDNAEGNNSDSDNDNADDNDARADSPKPLGRGSGPLPRFPSSRQDALVQDSDDDNDELATIPVKSPSTSPDRRRDDNETPTFLGVQDLSAGYDDDGTPEESQDDNVFGTVGKPRKFKRVDAVDAVDAVASNNRSARGAHTEAAKSTPGIALAHVSPSRGRTIRVPVQRSRGFKAKASTSAVKDYAKGQGQSGKRRGDPRNAPIRDQPSVDRATSALSSPVSSKTAGPAKRASPMTSFAVNPSTVGRRAPRPSKRAAEAAETAEAAEAYDFDDFDNHEVTSPAKKKTKKVPRDAISVPAGAAASTVQVSAAAETRVVALAAGARLVTHFTKSEILDEHFRWKKQTTTIKNQYRVKVTTITNRTVVNGDEESALVETNTKRMEPELIGSQKITVSLRVCSVLTW